MGRFKSDDFGYNFPSSSKTINDVEAEGERKPLTSKTGTNGDGYSLYEEKPKASPLQEPPLPLDEEATASAAYRYLPAKRNRDGESYLAHSEKEISSISISMCLGASCCCLTALLVIVGGILLVFERSPDRYVFAGSVLLVVAAGTCICGCSALCVGDGGGDGDGVGSLFGKGSGPKADPQYKEVMVRFRRLNDRYEKGCIKAEESLRDIRLDVVGSMKEIKEAAEKEAKKKTEKEEKDRKELEKRVKSDIERGVPTQTIRQNYRPVVFYIVFDGDVMVSSMELLRKQVSLIVNLARPGHDRCCISLTSSGGSVAHYGLAASHLTRIRKAGIFLTVCVDSVAASGGYMMASVADTICAAPFAIVGSVGVVTTIPNIQRFLNEHKIDAYLMTAGKHKRTIDMVGDVTEEGKAKLSEELDDIHIAFKDHIALARPRLRDSIEEVGTGEAWLAVQAKEKGLVDEILTSDEYLESVCEEFDIIEILEKMEKKQFGGPFNAPIMGCVVDKLRSALETPAKSNMPMAIM